MQWYHLPLVVLAGFVTGFINTLAGSGSAVSLAMLSALGLPMDVANGTNRVAIVLQNIVGVRGFHKAGLLDWRRSVVLAVPTCLGSLLGAVIACSIEVADLRRAVGVAMLVILATLFIRPKRWIEGRMREAARPTPLQMLLFLGIGVYGGFIQMGIGVFLLTSLVLNAGFDVVRGNAAKVLIVLLGALVALAVFIVHGQIIWTVGLVLACGNMLGAWVATREAARRGAVFVRALLIVVVSLAALRYLGVLDLRRHPAPDADRRRSLILKRYRPAVVDDGLDGDSGKNHERSGQVGRPKPGPVGQETAEQGAQDTTHTHNRFVNGHVLSTAAGMGQRVKHEVEVESTRVEAEQQAPGQEERHSVPIAQAQGSGYAGESERDHRQRPVHPQPAPAEPQPHAGLGQA